MQTPEETIRGNKIQLVVETLLARPLALACASAVVALEVDRNGFREVVAEVADILLRKSLSRDDFECLLDVDRFLCARLKVWDTAF